MGAAVSARRGVKTRQDSGVELCKIYSREIVPREWLRPSRFRTRLTSHERRRKSAGRQCYLRAATRDEARDEGAVGIDNRTTRKIPVENAREAQDTDVAEGEREREDVKFASIGGHETKLD